MNYTKKKNQIIPNPDSKIAKTIQQTMLKLQKYLKGITLRNDLIPKPSTNGSIYFMPN
jgi:hypothetical protein